MIHVSSMCGRLRRTFLVLFAVVVAGWPAGPGSAAEFTEPAGSTAITYQKGVWTDRVSFERDGDGWRGSGARRDPFTFKVSASPSVTMSFRPNGGLEVAAADGSKTVWETPYRLIVINRYGLRTTHVSERPILRFEPGFLEADRAVLLEYFSDNPGVTAFSASVLDGTRLVEHAFTRSEQIAGQIDGENTRVWRWGGEKPARPSMYADAVLTLFAPFDVFITAKNQLVGWTDPPRDVVTVVEGYEPFTPVRLWLADDVSKPVHTTVTVAEQVMIPMADWVPLAATVLLPGDGNGKAPPGPFPTVLIRTPYNRTAAIADAFKFVSRGYAVVAQDVRGTGDSEGFFHAIHNDISDGDVTLDWIASQPWSDGGVGMIGGSYVAWVQWQAAASDNPHLKAMISIVPTTSAFGDLPYVNGLFGTGILTWCVYMGADSQELFAQAMTKDLNAIASELPLIDADLRAVGHEIPFWRYWVTHSTLDDYWQEGNILNHQDAIDLPVLHITGWYDDVLRGTMVAWDMMQANQRANQQLVVGPWPHHANSTRGISELGFGPDSVRADMEYFYIRWFDKWLKGKSNGAENDPAVRYFTMGENEWKTADTWPPKTSVEQTWYLHSEGNASSPGDGASLTTQKPGGETPDRYTHDPADPAPYLVDIRANQLNVPEDYQEVERRPDTIVYTTEPFNTDFELTGTSKMVLYAATDQRDTDWAVRITDVFPDGRSVNLVDGYMRARFREGVETEVLVDPGEINRYEIPLTWTSYRFAEGHRMRVIIASAAAGLYVVNTNTGNNPATDTEIKVANQTIYHDAEHPSHVVISVAGE
jgi:putative CocE/NonD family hydrolase